MGLYKEHRQKGHDPKPHCRQWYDLLMSLEIGATLQLDPALAIPYQFLYRFNAAETHKVHTFKGNGVRWYIRYA